MFSNFSRLEFVDITGARFTLSSAASIGANLMHGCAGLRIDGRRAEEVRHTTFSRVIVPGADGAVFLQQGGTHVLASVWGPREVLPSAISRSCTARFRWFWLQMVKLYGLCCSGC
jgi:hypothetical protein